MLGWRILQGFQPASKPPQNYSKNISDPAGLTDLDWIRRVRPAGIGYGSKKSAALHLPWLFHGSSPAEIRCKFRKTCGHPLARLPQLYSMKNGPVKDVALDPEDSKLCCISLMHVRDILLFSVPLRHASLRNKSGVRWSSVPGGRQLTFREPPPPIFFLEPIIYRSMWYHKDVKNRILRSDER